jgi:hypothetical protein
MEKFMRSRYLFSGSKNSSYFMEPERFRAVFTRAVH